MLASLFLVAQPTLSQAGCGCDKEPPAPALVRPQATYAGAEVSLFHPTLQSGQYYNVVFTSGTTGQSATVQAQALTRKDLADGQYKLQLVVPVPQLPLGPTTISVSLSGQSGALFSVSDDAFTLVPQPVVLPEAIGEFSLPNFQAAVSRDGVVYLSLDLSAVTLPRTFRAQALGYPLHFASEDVLFFNTQGFVMQLLEQGMPGLFSLQAANNTLDSNILQYSRHEFNTFYLQHAEKQPHEVDAQDANWHLDESPHIDHDRLVVAIAGYLDDGLLPAAGATPPFELVVNTFSLFHHGLVGNTSVELSSSAKIYSHNPIDGFLGSEGDILSNGGITLSGAAIVGGNATWYTSFDISGNARVTGWVSQATEPTEFMPVNIPEGLENLGNLSLGSNDILTLAPGSYLASEVSLKSNSKLHIANLDGPVTLYVTGEVLIKSGGEIVVDDLNPEKFAIYVTGGEEVELKADGIFYGVVYAPESLVEIKGSGEFFGAFVGDEVMLTESAIVYYNTLLRGDLSSDEPDSDNDNVADSMDNCPTIANSDQLDANGDGFGDACVCLQVDIAADAVLGYGVIIGCGVKIESGAVVGDKAIIEQNAILEKDASLGSGSTLGANSELKQRVSVGDGAQIGSNVKLEEDVVAGNNLVVGDGTEVKKKTTLGSDTMIGSECSIDEEVQIGEGVTLGNNVTVKEKAVIPDNTVIPDGATVS